MVKRKFECPADARMLVENPSHSSCLVQVWVPLQVSGGRHPRPWLTGHKAHNQVDCRAVCRVVPRPPKNEYYGMQAFENWEIGRVR